MDDPVLRHARREALIILAVWLATAAYCCFASYFFGYTSEAHPLGRADVRPKFGIPSWFLWGVLAPWVVCGVFTIWFAGWFMAEDDLGEDHAAELQAEIREEGTAHE